MAVDFALDWEKNERVGLVGVYEVADGVVDDGGAGDVDESFHCFNTAGAFKKVPGAIDVDGVKESGVGNQCDG